MPKIQKQFHLEISVEQFLNACSYLELQELSIRLDSHLRRAEHQLRRQAYREGRYPEELIEVKSICQEMTRAWREYFDRIEKEQAASAADLPDTNGEGSFLYMKVPKK